MEEEIVMVPGDDYEEVQEKFLWGPVMVKLLIDEFKKVQHEFSHNNVKKKHVWRKIAMIFAGHGYQVTEDMCDKKWRNLKKTFKEIYLTQCSTNNPKTKWPYYNDVEEIFSKDPNIVNAATALSKPTLTGSKRINGPDGRKMRVELMEVVGNLDEEYLDGSTSLEGEDSQFWTTCDNSSEEEPPAWFSKFLQQYRTDEEKRMEVLNKMHKEVLAVEEKKCMLLASLIDKLGGIQEIPEENATNYYFQLGKDDDTEIVLDN